VTPIATRSGCWRADRSLDPCEGYDMKLVVPLVEQQSGHDCGAACVEMLLRYHGRPVPRDLRKLCSPHDGLQPDAVKAVLQRELGHYASSRMTPGVLKGFLRDGKPVLCPMTFEGWSSSHWVVSTGYSRNLIWYACPVEGHRSLTEEKWLACWREESGQYPQWGVTSWPP
jgi:ABC-type bacteriocin/lantibiotic exporter with double-glycine peptidase domain